MAGMESTPEHPAPRRTPTGRTDVEYEDILEHPYWRHRIDLGEGRFTPGCRDASDWHSLGLPEDMSGRSFLDIGAFDGLHAFEAEKRGAEHVLATDVWDQPTIDPTWWNQLRPGKQGFDLAHGYLDSDVDSQTIGIEEVSPETVGTFDVVLCAGVVYHLKDPFGGIRNAVSVADEYFVVESAVSNELDGTAMEFLRGSELDENPSNWWVPSPDALEDMVRACGCEVVEAGHRPLRDGESPVPPVRDARLEVPVPVFHSPQRKTQIDRAEAPADVSVLMTQDDVARIEYRDGASKNQGWIRRDALAPVPNTLPSKAARIVREEGLGSLARAGVEKFAASETPNNRYVVVARCDDASAE